MKNGRKPKLALLGLAFKPNVDDLRESPANVIVKITIKNINDELYFIVEPNIKNHIEYKITELNKAVNEADIIAILVGHDEFKSLNFDENKILLDFCGINKKL